MEKAACTIGHVAEQPSPDSDGQGFGANSWLVEEMYEQFRQDPDSVSESWREFFVDFRPVSERAEQQAPAAATSATRAAPTRPAQAEQAAEQGPAEQRQPATQRQPAAGGDGEAPGTPIRGAGKAIVTNMQRSLEVPTATSFRDIPAKLLEVNRKVINGYRSRTGLGKVSFTHLIGYAAVRRSPTPSRT